MAEFRKPLSKTKIICTVGPACESQAVLERMMRHGMTIARVNLSHGDLDRHAETIRNIRAAARATGHGVAIWGDLPGPKMRIGDMIDGVVQLQPDQCLVISPGGFIGDATRVPLGFSGLHEAVQRGDKIHLNDGLIQIEVETASGEEVHCRILDGGALRSHDGVNLPGIDLGVSAFTDQDRLRLEFAAEQGLDAVSPSFIQDAKDLEVVSEAAKELNYAPFLLAKIERATAVRNLERILASADAVVVARGDLGIETPIEEVALLQKEILRQARLAGKPAITATHMLQSMASQRLPTRAEVADVTNAILDGTDCLTLSAETALGSHPAETVEMMNRIALTVESRAGQNLSTLGPNADAGDRESSHSWVMAELKSRIAEREPAAILIPPSDEASAQRLSRLRLPAWILAMADDESAFHGLQFFWGVQPLQIGRDPGDWVRTALGWLSQQNMSGNFDFLPWKGCPPWMLICPSQRRDGAFMPEDSRSTGSQPKEDEPAGCSG
jgi:pyruvate kinase